MRFRHTLPFIFAASLHASTSWAGDLSGDVGVVSVSGSQWRVVPGHGIRICADGAVWMAEGRCLNRLVNIADAVNGPSSDGMSPAQYVTQNFGKQARLVQLSMLPPYGDQPPMLSLVYTLGK